MAAELHVSALAAALEVVEAHRVYVSDIEIGDVLAVWDSNVRRFRPAVVEVATHAGPDSKRTIGWEYQDEPRRSEARRMAMGNAQMFRARP